MEAKINNLVQQEATPQTSLGENLKTRRTLSLEAMLRIDPPAFSVMKNIELKNLYIVTSSEGGPNKIGAWRSIQSMTDLRRFARKLPTIRKIVESGYGDLKFFEDYCSDFSEAWGWSSNEIILANGFDTTLDILRLLKRVQSISWGDAIEYFLDEDGRLDFPDSLHVYRGESKKQSIDGNPRGISWTTDKATAECYARGLTNGVLYEGEVAFKDVLLFHSIEMEAVVNPGSVRLVGS